MPAIAAFGLNPSVVMTLRRGIPRGGSPVLACRTPAALERVVNGELLDAILLPAVPQHLPLLRDLGRRYPAIPVVGCAPVRADDAGLLLLAFQAGLKGVIVEGVDDAAAAELTDRVSASREMRALLREAPRTFGLTDAFQVRVWGRLLDLGGVGIPVRRLATELGVSREHLARQFGAGGAPTLKRAIDFLRIAWAARLLGCPGYTVACVARILGFSSASHLGVAARRITGVTAAALAALGPRGALNAFVRGGTRGRRRHLARHNVCD